VFRHIVTGDSDRLSVCPSPGFPSARSFQACSLNLALSTDARSVLPACRLGTDLRKRDTGERYVSAGMWKR
jgi:hypothetical protein